MRSMVEGMTTRRSTIERARRLRRELTLPEVLLWQALRRTALEGLRFRRQHPIGPYILDFYCPACKLCVEVDGTLHDHPAQVVHDERRTAWLAAMGIRTLRFNATDILHDERREDVLATIVAVASAPPPPSAVPLPALRGGPRA